MTTMCANRNHALIPDTGQEQEIPTLCGKDEQLLKKVPQVEYRTKQKQKSIDFIKFLTNLVSDIVKIRTFACVAGSNVRFLWQNSTHRSSPMFVKTFS